jgi:hypothetical protein
VPSAKLLTTAAVAEHLAISVDSVLLLIRSGKLLARNVSVSDKRPRWRVDESELTRFLDSRTSAPMVQPPKQDRKQDGDFIRFY